MIKPVVMSPTDLVALQRAEQDARRQKLRVLLARAQRALADDRLMIPSTDNAYNWYQQVLSLDDVNAEAHWGMQQISNRYVQLAEQAFESGRPELAEKMLQGAGKVAAIPTDLDKIRQRYEQPASDNEFILPISALTKRSDKIIEQLESLALQAHANQSRLLIIARNDEEGRWIYQKMRMALDGFRLRGNIEVGRVPRVVLIDL
jgi:hypothetical protein